jgi:hypothetical protein
MKSASFVSHKKERDGMRIALRIVVIVISKVAICAAALFAQTTPQVLAPEQKRVVSSVETMFRAAASNDPRLFDSVTTPGFYLFDAGTRFDGNSILTVLQQLKVSGKRFEWKVTEPDVHIEGNTAWIAYVDEGSMIEAAGTTKMEWLESAFLVSQAGEWKLMFMQSTPVTRASSSK